MVITFLCLIIFSFFLDISGAADSYTIITDSRKICEDFDFNITFTSKEECNDGAKTAAPGYTWVDWGTTDPDDPGAGCILYLGYGESSIASDPWNIMGFNYYTTVCKIPEGTSPKDDCTSGLGPVNSPCTCNAYDGTKLRASVTCNKGQVCTPALVTTKESIIRLCEAPKCGNTNGTTVNDKACTCGDVSVVTTIGEFSSKRPTCEPEQYCNAGKCTSDPLCEKNDGITQNTAADCSCDGGDTCNTDNGRYCSSGKCTDDPICSETDGIAQNTAADCSCDGGETCNAANGRYCSSGKCTDDPICLITDGITQNTADCSCDGGETCNDAKGRYCSSGKCTDDPLCSETDGITQNTADCSCNGGGTCNTANGTYCSSGKCTDDPLCSETDGITQNSVADCSCNGGDTCNTDNGRYCLALPSAPGFCREYPSTWSYYIENDGRTCGNNIINNTEMCQYFSEQGLPWANNKIEYDIKDRGYSGQPDGCQNSEDWAWEINSYDNSACSSTFKCICHNSSNPTINLCNKTDGRTNNTADCSCNGGDTCNTDNGRYCLALPSTPGFCQEYPSTWSYYIKEGGTCGDHHLIDNLEMCQYLSEQGLPWANNKIEYDIKDRGYSGQPDGCQNSEDWAWEINFYDNSACSSTFKCICHNSSNPTSVYLCEKTDGNDPNDADCSCNGGDTCNTDNGRYCLALPSTPGFCREYPSTWSYYIKEGGTCGDHLIDNLEMCQYLSEQSIVGLIANSDAVSEYFRYPTLFNRGFDFWTEGCQNSEFAGWEWNSVVPPSTVKCSTTYRCICQDSSNPVVRNYCPDQSGKNSELCTCGTRHPDAPICQEDEYCYGTHSQCKTFGGGAPAVIEVSGPCTHGTISLDECQRIADSVAGNETADITVVGTWQKKYQPSGCWYTNIDLSTVPSHGFVYNDLYDEDMPKCGETNFGVEYPYQEFVPVCLCYETDPATIHPPCNDDPSMKNDEICACGTTFCNADEYCLVGFRRLHKIDWSEDTFGTEDQCSSTGRFNFIVEDLSNECNASRGLAMITDKSLCGTPRRMADELGTDVLPAGCWYVNAETGEEGSDLAGLRLDMYWNPLTTEELAPPLVVDYGEAPSFCKADDFAPCPTDGFLTENCVCGTTDLCEPISSSIMMCLEGEENCVCGTTDLCEPISPSIMMCLEGEDPGARCQPCKYKDENGKCRPPNTKCKHTNGLFPNEVDCQCGNEDCASSTQIEWTYSVRPEPCSKYGEIMIDSDDCSQYATDESSDFQPLSFQPLSLDSAPYGCFMAKNGDSRINYNDMLSSTQICNDEYLCICKKLKSDTATCAEEFTEEECFKASLWKYGKQMQRVTSASAPFGCLLKKDTDGYFAVWNTNKDAPVRAYVENVDVAGKICKHEDMNLQILGNYCIEKDSTCIPTDFLHRRGGIYGLTCAINEELQMRCHCGDAFCEPGQFCLPDGTCSNDGPCDLRYPGLSHSECTCGFGTSTDRCSSPYYESIDPCPETDRISGSEECARAHEYLQLKTEDIYVLANVTKSFLPDGCVGRLVLDSELIWKYEIVWNNGGSTDACTGLSACNSHICKRNSPVEKPFCTLENDIGTCQASLPCDNVQGAEYNTNVHHPFLNYQCICGKQVCTSGLRLKIEECKIIPNTAELCEAAILSQGLQFSAAIANGNGASVQSGCSHWVNGYNTWNPSDTIKCHDNWLCSGMICADYCSGSLSELLNSTACGTKAADYGYTFVQIDDDQRPSRCFIDTHLNSMVWNSGTADVGCVDNECLRHHCSTPEETPYCDTTTNPDGICSNVKLREYPCRNKLGIYYNNDLCQCGTDVCEPAHVFTDTACTKTPNTPEDCKAVTEMASITFSTTLRDEDDQPSGCQVRNIYDQTDGIWMTFGVWNSATTDKTCADTINCAGRLCMDDCKDLPQTDKATCKNFADDRYISFGETISDKQPHGCFFMRYVEDWDRNIRPKIYWNQNPGTDLTCLYKPYWLGCHRKWCPPPTKRGYCNAELNVCSVNKNPSCSIADQFAQIEPGEECPAGYVGIKTPEECANYAQQSEIMTVEYSLRETGTCEDDGGTIITDHEECTLAAVELGKSKDLKTAGIANNAGSPPGCLFHPSWGTVSAPQFNNIGEQNCGANGYHCICKKLTVNRDETYTYGNSFLYESYSAGCLLVDNKAYFNAAYLAEGTAHKTRRLCMLKPELEGCQCSRDEVCNAGKRTIVCQYQWTRAERTVWVWRPRMRIGRILLYPGR